MPKLSVNRRDALKTMAAGAAGAGLLPMFGARAVEKRPNIIFMLTDDHRYDAFGFMDKPWLKTPNMDRIASEGVNFENTFVTTSLCSPSRASFLTGQYAQCHGVMNNATPWKDSNVTYLELLHAAGYHTGFIGKWHMPGKGVPDMKAQGKVDRMVSFSNYGGQGVYNDCPMIVDGEETKTKGYITDILTDYALDFMNSGGDSPFCLYLSHKAVHAAFDPPDRYEGVLDDAPLPEMRPMDKDLPLGLVNQRWKQGFDKFVQGYYEALMAVDDSVGSVLSFLDDKGIAENTIVVYAGDNGYFWGEHGMTDKRYAYEESIRVPQIMRYPRMVDGGANVEEMVLNIDLMPTVLNAAGVDVPKQVQGEDFMPLARGKSVPWRDSFLYEYYSDVNFPVPPIKAVRTMDWKLITYGDKKGKYEDEMYNLKADPGEKINLIDHPGYDHKEKELREEMTDLEKELECPGA